MADEDEDREALVFQNRRSAFEISTDSRIANYKRYFLVAISLLLSFIIVVPIYFCLLNGVDTSSDLMLESELKALSLLKDQQLSLLHLYNQTLTDDLRSSVLDQIKVNEQIQKALLSSHVRMNSTLAGPGLCKTMERANNSRTIEWKPKKDRFLFAICLSGQMSNHLICLEKHMFFAALLDRLLVFPSPKIDYLYDQVLDLNHINDCFGRKVVVSFDEFVEMNKGKLKIDRFICYVASPPCYLDDVHVNRLKNLGIALGKIEAAWPEDAKLKKEQKKRVVEDIMAKFSSDDDVLAIGDMFYAAVEEEWVMQPGGPLAHKCKTLIQPSQLIVLTAQRFVQTFLGRNFVALHFRRHGFLKFCNMKDESCFFPIPQAAECILRVVERANAPVIYLATDAAESETDLLQSLLVPNSGKQIQLVKRPGHNSTEKWDALLYRNQLGDNIQVEAMLDKTICAMSSVFIGSPGSTFTEDIIRLRRGWGSATQCDEYLCQGERPDFIADNE